MRKFAGLWLILTLSPVCSYGITFSDQTLDAWVHDTGFGNGPSFADYDGDGWPDLLVARFSRSQEALLYRNRGDGQFSWRPDALEDSQNALAGMFVDLQADGDLDIFLLKYSNANQFYENVEGSFRTIPSPPGLIDAPRATSALFGDFDGDGEVDLFLTHRTSGRNRLYSGILTDHGTDITDVTSTLESGEDSWGATAFDYDGDGYRDLYVSNFGATNRLYRNLGDGTFRPSTEAAGLQRPSKSRSAIAADFDNDSDLDLYVLNAAPETNTLYENRGGRFVDITEAMGVGGDTSGEGGAWADLDNDGDLDLLVVDGESTIVRRNDGNRFADVSASAYPTTAGSAKHIGLAIADYDRDGDVDVFVASNDAGDVLLRNDTPATGHWLEIELVSRDDGESPLGTVLYARLDEDTELTRDHVVGSSIGIVHGDLLHLGTGGSETISEIIVAWPSGKRQTLSDVPTGQVLRLREPQPQRDLAISRILGPQLDSSWETGVESEVEITNRGLTTVDDALLQVTITFEGAIVHTSSLPVPALAAGEMIRVREDRAWHPRFSGEHLVEFRLEAGDELAANDYRARRLYMHRFEEVAALVGVDDDQLGFAAAFADYDNDGDLDLYLNNGGWHGDEDNVLYRNDGDAGFTDVTQVAGVASHGNGTGVLFADFDRDGYLDLFAARGGFVVTGQQNLLFHNDGDGTFSDISVDSGLDRAQSSFGVTAGDYDGDGYLDLFISQAFNNILYRKTEGGRFEDVTKERQVRPPPSGGSSAASFADYDNDGDLDLYVTNFGDADVLHSETGEASYTATQMGDQSETLGISPGDVDDDGDLDLYVVNSNGASALWRNDLAQGTFTDVAVSSGVTNMGRGNAGTFGDYDNDGDLDIFVVNTRSSNRVYVNEGNGHFIDRASAFGIDTSENTRGLVLGDYDADGDLDVYVMEEHRANRLYRNGGSQHNWLDITLRGVESNLDGIGARVTAHYPEGGMQMREVRAAGEYSANYPGARFGLNDVTRLDSLVVAWPSGTVDTHREVATNARLELMEGIWPTAIEEEGDGPLPLQFALEPNFPNPFNSATSMGFTIAEESAVRLAIYNSVGQLISVLVDERLSVGRYTTQWHGHSDGGQAAASGVYFASLTAGQDAAQQSIILIK